MSDPLSIARRPNHKTHPAGLAPGATALDWIGIAFLGLLLSACGGHKQAPSAGNPAPPALPEPAPIPDGMDPFDVRAHPNAQILHPRDLGSLTESERQFGVAPKRDPSVEYQPDIILMEQGDKAIKSIASNGLTWTFDAHAPQVGDFQEGKIVFATSRAVGRVLTLRKTGDTVEVILGPIQLTDVIREGNFVVNESALDMNHMIRHDAPDWPQPSNEPAEAKAASLGPSGHVRSAFWRGGGGQMLPADVIMPGAPGIGQLPKIEPPPPPLEPPGPTVDIQQVRVQPIANNSGIGSQFYYSTEPLHVYAGSRVQLTGSQLGFFLLIKKGHIVNCGIEMKGAAAIDLQMDSYATKSFEVNFKKHLWLPIDFEIPLGGPVPFAIKFDTGFDVATGFSARTSMLSTKGSYAFSGGLVAGYVNNRWTVAIPTNLSAPFDIGRNVAGVSVGINSLRISADVRATVGLGAFGFTTGVFGNLRFGGTALRQADITSPCRAGTVETWVDTGVGYSMPGWAADAVNYFLSFFSTARIERVGSFLSTSDRLFHGDTAIPAGCSGKSAPKAGAT